MVMDTDGTNYTGISIPPFIVSYGGHFSHRPRTTDVTLSLLRRAKNNGFTALVVTLDTMMIGWRPHDLARAYLPFGHGVGIQVGMSDPVFMARYNRQPIHQRPKFPYEPAEIDEMIANGDEKMKEGTFFGSQWVTECNSGQFRDWEDLKFLRDNWEGPLILKGIQSVHVRLTFS